MFLPKIKKEVQLQWPLKIMHVYNSEKMMKDHQENYTTFVYDTERLISTDKNATFTWFE